MSDVQDPNHFTGSEEEVLPVRTTVGVSIRFTFEAAHYLPSHVKCGETHGHSYVCWLSIVGGYNRRTGMAIDFHELKTYLKQFVVAKLDHKLLNDVKEIGIPTAENIALWIRDQVCTDFPKGSVSVQETENNVARVWWEPLNEGK